MNIASIVLAAGGSSRLGEPKQLLRDSREEALVHMAAREALETGAKPVIVVVGAVAQQVGDAVSDLDVLVVQNPLWDTGLSSSIKSGVREVSANRSIDGVLLVTCDMPAVGAPHLRRLLDAFEGGAARVASQYGDTVGVPAVIARAEFDELLALTGDRGAKSLFMRHDTVRVALDGGTFDLDTPADVAAWRAGNRS